MASTWGASWGTAWGNSWGPVGVAPPVVVAERPAGGYWPDYGQPRRKRVPRETHDESPVELQARLALAAEQLRERAALRKAEARSRYLTEQIRSLLDEQDRMSGRIVLAKAGIERERAEDDDIAMILALVS